LGDLVTDALLWYANNAFEGFDPDVPVVAIQNGGNIYDFLYNGQVTRTDIFRAFPYSPAGIGVLYVTGEELLETLEEANQTNPANGFPHVSGMTYNIDLDENYDASTTKGPNGNGEMGEVSGVMQYYADSWNRVSIKTVGGKPFDPKATYAVVADNMVVANGLDTYKTFQAVKNSGAKYITNGTGIKTRNVVELYLQYGCKKKISDKYAEPQDRITFGDSNYKKAKAAAAKAKKNSTPAKYLTAAKKQAAEAAITCNPDKIAEAAKVVADAQKEVKASKVKTVTVNVATVNAKAISKAVTKAGGKAKYVTKIIIGKKTKKIAAKAFAKYKKTKNLVIKTKKLKKAKVKNSLKNSAVRTIKVNVGTKKANKTYVKKYKKIFTKKNAGKKVTVK
ncbi:MAG: 5'-nucleotidase C-terminal domain-containing protein, partial [Bacillota bacterium]|nr:5'-nucleotidase C-terminal domain-containing protein [Bacillota bacterium]